MAVFTLATFLLAFIFIIGVPALAIVRAWDKGLTLQGVLWGSVAAVWLGLLLVAVIRDRETRGWMAFLLVGWVFRLPELTRTARR